MKTTIFKKDFWTSDEFIDLHLDSKCVYLYLLSCPDKGYLPVFKFNKHLATLCTGMSNNSIDAAITELSKNGYIEVYNGYVGLVRGDVSSIGGPYGAINTERELSSLPIDVREHFDLDNPVVKKEPSKRVKKVGRPAETLKDILDKQPQDLQAALSDFIEDRKERKRPATTRAVKGWINKLETMYPNDINKRIGSIEQSIERGWHGLFEIRESFSDKEKDRKFM